MAPREVPNYVTTACDTLYLTKHSTLTTQKVTNWLDLNLTTGGTLMTPFVMAMSLFKTKATLKPADKKLSNAGRSKIKVWTSKTA